MFSELNTKPKPKQPVTTVFELQVLSIASKELMDPIMLTIRNKVDHTCVTNTALALEVGGVVWSPAPRKRTIRVVEKICLEPSSSRALETQQPEALVADGMLDTVRVSWWWWWW